MKLHLPKMLLTAVIAALVSVPASALTGWGNSYTLNGGTYFIDQTEATTIDQKTGKPNETQINIVADTANLAATASVTAKQGITLVVCSNPWPDYHLFNSLLLTEVQVENNGGIELKNEGVNVTINQVSGTLTSVTNSGTLTIGTSTSSTTFGGTITNTGALTIGTSTSTTTFGGTITNTGTLTINGAIAFKVDANSSFGMLSGGATTYSYNSENEEGFKTVASAQYELIGENSGTINITAEQEGMTITRDETTGNVTSVIFSDGGFTDDTFRINGSNINEAALIADTATTGVTATTKYNLVAGTLTVADDISTERLSYSGGTLVLGSNTLTIADGNTQLLLNTTGAGNVTLTANLQLAQEQITQATGKLTISGAQLNLGDSDLNPGYSVPGASISSFTAVELDDGTIRVQNPDGTINNLSVTANGGTIDVYDLGQPAAGKVLTLAGTTTLTGDLKLTSTYNTQIEIEELAGSGNVVIDDARNEPMALTIDGKDAGYSGEVQVKSNADQLQVNVAENLGLDVHVSTSSGEMNLTGIAAGNQIILQGASGSMTAGSIVVADVEIKNSADGYYAGMEIATAADNDTMKYTGKITGDGNYIVIPIKTVDEQKVSVSTTTEFAGDTSGWTGKMEVVNATQNVIYSGSETINNSAIQTRNANTTIDDPVMNLTIKHDSAAVKVNSAISGAVNMTVNAAEGATFTKDVTVKTTDLADGTTAEFNGTTDLGDLTLGAGASVTGSGNLTIGELVLDLQSYTTDYSNSHTLVSTTGTLSFTGSLDGYTGVTVGNYTATVKQSDNSITLSFEEIVAPSGDITTTVTSQGGFADGMLTLNVDADLADASKVLITGISDSIMAEILGLNGLPEDGMVGITLKGAEDSSFTATADQQIGFQANDGVSYYFGENVGGAWQYQVAYIPEPATATLSLLALAGLAARRRRKA